MSFVSQTTPKNKVTLVAIYGKGGYGEQKMVMTSNTYCPVREFAWIKWWTKNGSIRMLLNPRYIEKREVHHLPVGRNAELFSACWIKKLDHCSITVDLKCQFSSTNTHHFGSMGHKLMTLTLRCFFAKIWRKDRRFLGIFTDILSHFRV